MKIFLILTLLFLSINTYADTYSDINKLTVNDSITALLSKYYPETEYKFDPLREDDNRSNYDRLLEPKPTFEELQEKLVIYKAELTAIEDAQLAEIARVEDLKNRIKAIGGIFGKHDSFDGINSNFAKCGITGNYAILIKKYIKENDVAKIECLESKHIEIQDELLSAQVLETTQRNQMKSIRTKIINSEALTPAEQIIFNKFILRNTK